MKPSLHPVACSYHGVVTATRLLIQVLSFILLHSVLLVKYFHVLELEIIDSLIIELAEEEAIDRAENRLGGGFSLVTN